MEQYISKAAVVAEIERRRNLVEERLYINSYGKDKALYDAYKSLLSFIDTLEMKKVDLEKELIKWHKQHFKKDGTFIGMSGFYLTNNSQMDIAKHFFELGLNASNPLTWEDISVIRQTVAEYRREENHERNNEDFCKEVLKRFKAKKGEKV